MSLRLSNSSKLLKIGEWAIILLIIGFSFYTKVNDLGKASFDSDEIYSVKSTISSYYDLAVGLKYDPGNPPLYFMMLKSWKNLVGENESKLRFLSVVFSMAALAFFAFEVKKFLKFWPSVLSIWLLATSDVIFFFSRYARAYSLLLLICIVVFFYLTDLLSKKEFSTKKTVAALILSLIGLYSHYSFVPFYVFLFIALFIVFRSQKERIERLLIFTGFIIIGFLPWAILFLMNQIMPVVNWQRYSFWQLNDQWIGLRGWMDIFTNGLYQKFVPFELQTFLAFLLFIVFDIFLVISFRKTKDSWQKTVLVFFLIGFNILLFTPFHLLFHGPRYSLYLIPFAFLSLGIILNLARPGLAKLVSIILFVLIIPWGLTTYSSYGGFAKEEWRGLAMNMSQFNDNGIILFNPCYLGYFFDYYYERGLPMYCFVKNDDGTYFSVWDRSPQKTLYFIHEQPDSNQNKKLLDDLIKNEHYVVEENYFGRFKLSILRK